MIARLPDCPTSLFPIFEPQNPGIDKFDVFRERRETDFKAPKLWKGKSCGTFLILEP